jgi:hypothetical protein
MTTTERTTPTQGRNISAPAVVEPRATGATSSDARIREEPNHILARWVIELPPSRCRLKVALGAPG